MSSKFVVSKIALSFLFGQALFVSSAASQTPAPAQVDGKPTLTWTAHDSGNQFPTSEDYYCNRDQVFSASTPFSDGNKQRIAAEVKDWCKKKFPDKVCEPTYTTPGSKHLICGGNIGTAGAVPADWSTRVHITCNCTDPEPEPKPSGDDPKPGGDGDGSGSGGSTGGGAGGSSGGTGSAGDASFSPEELYELDEIEIEYLIQELELY